MRHRLQSYSSPCVVQRHTRLNNRWNSFRISMKKKKHLWNQKAWKASLLGSFCLYLLNDEKIFSLPSWIDNISKYMLKMFRKNHVSNVRTWYRIKSANQLPLGFVKTDITKLNICYFTLLENIQSLLLFHFRPLFRTQTAFVWGTKNLDSISLKHLKPRSLSRPVPTAIPAPCTRLCSNVSQRRY